MAETKSARFSKEQIEAIEQMVEKGLADNESEAHRMLVNAGLHEYGFKNGGYTETMLKRACGELAKAFFLVGLVLVGVTYFYPVTFRILAVAPILSGLFLYALEDLLEQVEPNVTNSIRGLFGGESA